MYNFLLLILLGQSGYAGSPVDCIDAALVKAKVSSQDVVFDLGSGDGRTVCIASKIYKCKSVGIEYDRNLYELSKKTVLRNSLSSWVELRNEDALKSDLSSATVIYLYHQSEFLKKLKPQLDKHLEKTNARIICLDYPLPWRNDLPVKMMMSKDGHQHSIFIYYKSTSNNDSELTKAGKVYNGVRCYEGQRNSLLDSLAQTYSNEMAAINSQSRNKSWRNPMGEGHFGVEARYAKIRQDLGMKGDEVTAESWYWQSNSPMNEIAEGMFDSWRQSSGHWNVVSKPHKLYGDGLAKSRQGIWYATVLVAD